MKNVIKREQCKLACGLPSVNILSKVSKFKVLLYLKKSGLDKQGKTIFAPTKGTKANGMDKRKTQVNNIRFKSGLLCSPEHSKVCFLLHETPFAAQNSLLCRGLWLSSKVGQPIHTCRKHQVIIICQTQNNKDEQQEE